MVRTQVQLTEEQVKALRELSRAQDRSMSAIVRDAVDEAIRHRGMSRRERMERALSVIGKYNSGFTDISERHDDYLAEDFGS